MNVRIVFCQSLSDWLNRWENGIVSFEQDFFLLLEELKSNPFLGTQIGTGIRKVRMAIASKGKGKSSGARVLTYSVNKESDNDITITLMSIYDKSKISA